MKDQICKTVAWADHNLLPANFDPDTYAFSLISTLIRAMVSESGINTSAGVYNEATISLKFMRSEYLSFNPDIPKVFQLTTEKGQVLTIGYPNPCRMKTRELTDGIFSLVYVAKNVDS